LFLPNPKEFRLAETNENVAWLSSTDRSVPLTAKLGHSLKHRCQIFVIQIDLRIFVVDLSSATKDDGVVAEEEVMR
jgi:hypothetical protein